MVAAARLGALWGCTATPFPSQACNQMKGGEVGPDSRVLTGAWKKGELSSGATSTCIHPSGARSSSERHLG